MRGFVKLPSWWRKRGEEDEEKKLASSKMDRKTVERNRRQQMKTLHSQLVSLIPIHNLRELPLPEQLDEAASYIRSLEENIERMKERKQNLMGIQMENINLSGSGVMGGFGPPHIDIQEHGSTMRILLISGPDDMLIFYKIIPIIDEQGADVVNASFCAVDDKIFHTLYCQIRKIGNGSEASRISERLKKFVDEFSSAHYARSP